MALSREDRDYIRRRIDTRVERFASSVERVSFRLEDVNGQRGGGCGLRKLHGCTYRQRPYSS